MGEGQRFPASEGTALNAPPCATAQAPLPTRRQGRQGRLLASTSRSRGQAGSPWREQRPPTWQHCPHEPSAAWLAPLQ